MTTKKKAPTHCEKYGHSWTRTSVDGFEQCTNHDYLNKKLVPCPAIRHNGVVFASTPKQPHALQGVLQHQQLGMWEG